MIQKALVIGASGGTGQAITRELIKEKIPVKIFGRNQSKLKKMFPGQEIAIGDAFNYQDLINALNDDQIDTVFQTAAIPYSQTVEKQLPLAENIMKAVSAAGKKIVFVDGIYAYGDAGQIVTEDYIGHPKSKKGKIKKALTDLIFSPAYRKTQPILLRYPDYFGPGARKSSYLGGTLISIAAGKTSFYIGPKKIKREYIYLPDAAKMSVKIASDRHAYGQIWNLPGQKISGKKIISISQQIANKHRPVISLNKLLIRMIGIFDKNIAEIAEMYYLTIRPVYLNGEKYKKHFGKIIKSNIKDALNTTIKSYQGKN